MVLIAVAAILLLSGGLTGILWFQPEFAVEKLADLNPEVLFEVETQQKVVALTIDDGPHPDITPLVLDLLAEKKIHATFFVLGDHIPGNEGLMNRMKDEGHEIGNHLVEDRWSVLLPDEEFTRQMLAVDPWVDSDTDYRWLRPGSGWFTPEMVKLAGDHGYTLCLGSIYPHDDVVRDPETLANNVLGRVRPGAIIILHDGQDVRIGLVETLRLILDGLKKMGFQAMRVSELVRME